MHDPKVYLVFWGSWWLSSAESQSGIVPALQTLFGELAGGDYNNILSQYTNDNNDVGWAGTAYDNGTPPTSLSMAEIGQEAVNAITTNQWPNNSNTMVLVFPQPGTIYDPSFNSGNVTCGEHAYGNGFGGANPYVIFGMVRYTPDQSACNYSSGTTAGDMQVVASHEYAEMVTDPEVNYATAWNTSDGYEIGDLCNWGAQSYSPINTSQGLSVTYLWDNSEITSSYPYGQCMLQHGQEYPSPASPGKHTVQNGILGYYKLLGMTSSVLGEPVSEETPIAGGAVSYFVGPCSGNGPSGSCGAIYWSHPTDAHAIWGNDYLTYVNAQNGPGGSFGFPLTDPIYGSGGASSFFQGSGYCGTLGPVNGGCAAIFSIGSTTYVDYGNDLAEYYNAGGPGGYFGWPTTNPVIGSGGAVSFFQGSHYCGSLSEVNGGCAAVFSFGNNAYVDYGDDLARYYSVGGPGGNLGWPTSNPTSVTNGAISAFQHGAIYSYAGGTFADWGNDYNHYVAEGGQTGNLGWPTSNPIYQSGGAYSTFQNGAVYDSSYGTFAVWGNIYNKYLSEGGLSKSFGWPQTDPEYIDGGAFSEFQGSQYCSANVAQGCAAIYDSSAGTVAIWGNILQKYLNLGGVGSGLGWPTQDPVYVSGGAYSNLQSGAIYDSSVGTYEVNGAIYQAYVNYGGPGSALGFPVIDEYTNSSGYRESDFQHGYIVWANGSITITLYGSGGCSVTVSSPNLVTPNILPPPC